MTQIIDDKNKRPLGGVYAANSGFNAIQQQIDTALQKLDTVFLGRVESCATNGDGSLTVNVTPLTQMIDASGNAYQSPAYVSLPHYRVQAGIAALVIDPVPGDIGVFVCAKRDISNINSGTKNPVPPASFRSFNPADAVMVATIHTKKPTVYVRLKQDNTVEITAPAGVTIDAPETTITGNVKVGGTIIAQGNVTGDGISLNSHTHPGVEPGGSSTGGPQ